MLRTLLATSAVSALLISSAFAQAEQGAEPGADDEVLIESEDPAFETDDPAVAEDPALETDDPAVAEDPALETDDPAVAEDPALETDDPAVAEDPAAEPDPAAPTAGLDLAGVPPEELEGSDVLDAADERIATVDTVLADSIIVTFGGFLGLGRSRVELGPEDFEIHQEEDDLVVRTALSADELRERPAYEE